MAQFVTVNSYEDFFSALKTIPSDVRIFAEFYGAHDSSGKSWCPDCVKAEPVVDEVMKKRAPEGSFFLHVNVGDRTSWKSPDNPFRKDPQMKLNCIPTLVEWGTERVLREGECADESLVEDFVKG